MRIKLRRCWRNMKDRCANIDHADYVNYGGRGISVCKEWKNSFEAFYGWAMLNGHDAKLSIDRKNNDGNYGPSNCRWVEQKVQTRNTRKLYSHNTSGYRGVCFDKRKRRWRPLIKIDGKKKSMGTYKCRICAAFAYDSFVINNNLEHTRNF